jgi:hypothetical protein
MSYTLTASDNSVNIIIADGQSDTTSTGLTLPGPNFPGYGRSLNENLLSLLTSFVLMFKVNCGLTNKHKR